MNTRATEDGWKCRKRMHIIAKFPTIPCAIVMFGASGDLARRKLLPALYDLAVHACLAPRFRLLGYARTEMSDDEFRRASRGISAKSEGAEGPAPSDAGNKLDEFVKHLHYFSGDYDDPAAFRGWRSGWRKSIAKGICTGTGFFIWRRRRTYI